MNLVFDIPLSFQLPKSFHSHPSVFLVLWKQQRSDGCIELGYLNSVPGPNENNI